MSGRHSPPPADTPRADTPRPDTPRADTPWADTPWAVYGIDQIYICVCGLEVNKEVITALSPQLKADTPLGRPPPEQTPH